MILKVCLPCVSTSKIKVMIALIAILLTLVYFIYYEFYERRKNLPPGPMPMPILGNLHQLNIEKPTETFQGLSEQYGKIFTFWFGNVPNVVITDYKVIQEALVKQGEIFSGRNDNWILEELLGGGKYGLFQSHGPLWKEQRRFTLHVLRDFGFGRNLMEERVVSEVEDFLDNHIGQEILKGKSNGVLDIQGPLTVCVGNIINLLIIGYRFEHDDPEFKRLKSLLDENFQLFTKPEMILCNAYPWLRHLPIRGHFGYTEFIRQRDEFFSFFHKQLTEHKKDFDPSVEPTDYTAAYLKELQRREKTGEKMGFFSEWQLMMSMFGLWIAGLETTVTTLKWGFLFMIHNTEVQEKCRAEILEAMGDREDKVLKYADRTRTPYTSATLMEIQRLGNIIPLSPQHATLEDTVLEGYHIKKGTTILPSSSNVHVDPKIYPDPEKFRPERFLETDGKSVRKAEELLPFSLGKRQCLGESLARMELYLIFGSFLQKFRISAKPGGGLPSLKPVVGITFNTQPYEMMIEKV